MGCGDGGGSNGWAMGGLVEVEEKEGGRVSSVRKCVWWEREKNNKLIGYTDIVIV